jgi:hypothetical protein
VFLLAFLWIVDERSFKNNTNAILESVRSFASKVLNFEKIIFCRDGRWSEPSPIPTEYS